jgi:enhancing lycopene biosynthesis protein 2
MQRDSLLIVQELTSSSAAAILFPGGFGAAKNLCNFALGGDLKEPASLSANNLQIFIDRLLAGFISF